jgi:hypothetical protein
MGIRTQGDEVALRQSRRAVAAVVGVPNDVVSRLALGGRFPGDVPVAQVFCIAGRLDGATAKSCLSMLGVLRRNGFTWKDGENPYGHKRQVQGDKRKLMPQDFVAQARHSNFLQKIRQANHTKR